MASNYWPFLLGILKQFISVRPLFQNHRYFQRKFFRNAQESIQIQHGLQAQPQILLCLFIVMI